jgi:hypothetical protein
LVGTQKGAFILTSDGKRKDWKLDGPHFGGMPIYHLKGSQADPDRIYASQADEWFGQVVHRSSDGGKTWEAVGNEFSYKGEVGNHAFFDGTPKPWAFKRVWHFEPSLTDPDHVYAGVEDAALFESKDGGMTWSELEGLRGFGSTPDWHPGAGGLCLHTVILDPSDPKRIYIAISAVGAFRSDDAGASWKPINRGLRSEYIPDPEAEFGHCVHHALRPPRGHAPEPARRPVHAEALGRDAQRRLRRQLVRGQRQPPHGLRLRDRRARPRAGNALRRSDQKRYGAFPDGRQAPGLPQPHRRERLGRAVEGPAG